MGFTGTIRDQLMGCLPLGQSPKTYLVDLLQSLLSEHHGMCGFSAPDEPALLFGNGDSKGQLSRSVGEIQITDLYPALAIPAVGTFGRVRSSLKTTSASSDLAFLRRGGFFAVLLILLCLNLTYVGLQ